jgi:hypothetical protein
VALPLALSVVVISLPPPLLFCAGIAFAPLVPASPELLDPVALVVGMVAGVVAVALEAELGVAASENELVEVAHGGCVG